MNYADYVKLQCDFSQNILTFLCDTEADISVIKLSSFNNINKINKSEIISIKGIANDVVDSLGTFSANIIFKEVVISHIFHVVPNSFNIPSDGILGKDFNKTHKTKIDYYDMTFTIRTP